MAGPACSKSVAGGVEPPVFRCSGVANSQFSPVAAHFQHALTLHARGEVLFQHARTFATRNGCATPGGAATRGRSSGPRSRSSTGLTPAYGPTAPGPSCRPPARPSPIRAKFTSGSPQELQSPC